MDNSRLPVDKPGALGQVGCYKGNTGRHRRAEPVDKPVDKSAGPSVRCKRLHCPSVPFFLSVLSVLPIASQEHPNDVLFSRNSLNSQGNHKLCTGRPRLCVACYIVAIGV